MGQSYSSTSGLTCSVHVKIPRPNGLYGMRWVHLQPTYVWPIWSADWVLGYDRPAPLHLWCLLIYDKEFPCLGIHKFYVLLLLRIVKAANSMGHVLVWMENSQW